jgi:hypothetical protein
MTLDDRPVRADYDWGFKEGRQFGRGRSGGQVSSAKGSGRIVCVMPRSMLQFWPSLMACTVGQVRDEYRMDFDQGRGGYGQVSPHLYHLPPECMCKCVNAAGPCNTHATKVDLSAHAPKHIAFLLQQIFRQELEVRRAAIQHQQQQYGEGQDMPGSGGAPAAKRQKVVEAEPEPVGRQRDSDDEDD